MRKIALIGTAGSSNKAPIDDESWEIWGVSSRGKHITRATRWFELHRLAGETKEFRDEWRSHVGSFIGDTPLYMIWPEPDLAKNIKEFPVDYLSQRYGTYFMTSSFAWMMAMAIEELRPLDKDPVEGQIGIWGVDMEYATEYCIAPDTRVLTSDLRWVKASSVIEGDSLLGFDETSTKEKRRAYRKADVNSATKLKRPCYRLTMEDGTELISSSEHRWLTWSEHEFKWRRTDEMVTRHHRKDRPTKICKPLNVWDNGLDSRDAGYVAGGVDGEGHICQGTTGHRRGDLRIGFSQRDNAMSEEFISAMDRLGYICSGTKDKTGCTKYTINGGREKLIEFLGSIRPPRLISKFDASKLGIHQNMKTAVAIKKAEFIGDQDVIGIGTSTGTFFAEGFASHNSQQRAGFRHFIDLARFAGIPVTRLVTGGLTYEPIPYPMWQDDPLQQKVEDRTNISKHNLEESEGLIKKTSEAVVQNQFAQMKLKEFGNDKAPEEIVRLEEQRQELIKEWEDLLKGKAHWEATLEEQTWMANYLRP